MSVGHVPNSRRRSTRRIVLAAWLIAAPAWIGCREELGPIEARTTTVSGQVRVGDRPIAGGWIEFLPIDGTLGNLRSGPIDPLGRFRADDVPEGVVGIRLVGFPPMESADGRVAVFLGQIRQVYLIRRNIDREGREALDIDLAVEAYRTPGHEP